MRCIAENNLSVNYRYSISFMWWALFGWQCRFTFGCTHPERKRTYAIQMLGQCCLFVALCVLELIIFEARINIFYHLFGLEIEKYVLCIGILNRDSRLLR